MSKKNQGQQSRRSRPSQGGRTRLKRCSNCEVFFLKKYGHTCPPPPKEDDNG